ncbi:MAG: hypothetical protein Q7R47_05795 [Candidatus Diapherotrites archaeon]|nr:hypothetical protein [Candidatus Diapherotrites archaeon]
MVIKKAPKRLKQAGVGAHPLFGDLAKQIQMVPMLAGEGLAKMRAGKTKTPRKVLLAKPGRARVPAKGIPPIRKGLPRARPPVEPVRSPAARPAKKK